MTTYGGNGGVMEGRDINPKDKFEQAVNEVLGVSIRSDSSFAETMWQALANITWLNTNGDDASYSFRAAGDLVAAIRGEGNYLDWYCCRDDAIVSDEIANALATKGWRWEKRV